MSHQNTINTIFGIQKNLFNRSTKADMVVAAMTGKDLIATFLAHERNPQLGLFESRLSQEQVKERVVALLEGYKAQQPVFAQSADQWSLIGAVKDSAAQRLSLKTDGTPHLLMVLTRQEGTGPTRVAVGVRYAVDGAPPWFKRYAEYTRHKIVQITMLLEPVGYLDLLSSATYEEKWQQLASRPAPLGAP